MDFSFFLTQPWAEALGWMLLHSLWIGALLAAVGGLLLKTIPAKKSVVRYRTAWGTLVLFLLLNSWTFIAYWSKPTKDLAMIQKAEETQYTLLFVERPRQESLNLEPYIRKIESLLPILVRGWYIGLLFFALRFLLGFRQMQQYRRKGLVPIPNHWEQRFLEYAKEMGVKSSKLQLCESLRTKVPILIGHFKPLILLPAGTLTQTPPEYIEAVLKHELAHIRRSDFLTSVIQNFIEVVFYFNPFVWWISARIREEREHCCDDLAIQYACQAGTYAKALFHFRQKVEEPYPIQALAFLKKRSQFLTRLQRLLLPETTLASQKKYAMEKTALALIILSATFFLAFQTQQETATLQEEGTQHSSLFLSADTLPRAAEKTQLLIRGDSVKMLKMLQGNQAKEATLIILSPRENSNLQTSTLALSDLSEGRISIITAENGQQLTFFQDSSELPDVEIFQQRLEVEKMREEAERMRKEAEKMREEVERLKREAEKFKYADLEWSQIVNIDTTIIFDPETFEADTMVSYFFDPETLNILSRIFDDADKATRESSGTEEQPKTFEEKQRQEMALIKQAVFEGLIKDPDNYSFYLTPKKLVIDGKRQPKEVFERYKAMYEKLFGSPLKSSIKTKVKRQTSNLGQAPSSNFYWWNWWS